MTGVRVAVAVLVTALLPVLAACTGGGVAGPPDRASTGPSDLTVEVLQYRRDEADRRIEVKVSNGADHEVVVESVELVAPQFEGVGAVQVAAALPAGQRVDLRVAYGEPLCGRQLDAGEKVSVRLSPRSGEAVEVGPTAGAEVLQRIHDRECVTRQATAIAPLAWSTGWQPAGPGVVDGVLLVGPVTVRHTAKVVDLEGTTLFGVTAAGLPLAVGGGGTASVAVSVAPQRCDPHAVGESKRGYAFGVRVMVDGGPPDGVLVTVPPDEPGRRVLEATLLEHCRLTPSS